MSEVDLVAEHEVEPMESAKEGKLVVESDQVVKLEMEPVK